MSKNEKCDTNNINKTYKNETLKLCALKDDFRSFLKVALRIEE